MDLFKNDTFEIVVRCVIAMTTLFFMTKLLGKKQVSELSLFDYVVGISIGNFASEMAINLEAKFFNAMLAIVVFGILAYIISILTLKSLKLRKFFIGSPTILLEHGNLIYKNMKKSMIDVNDILSQAREMGYFDISEVEFAILEANGKISFLPKGEYKNVNIKDMNLKIEKQGLCANVIIDGNIMNDNLINIGKDEKWLLHELDVKGKNVSDILLATVDINDKIVIFDRRKDIDSKNTKYKRLFNAFCEQSRKDNSTNCVYKFIQVCMEPARGLNTQSAYEKRRFEVNRVLMLKGIEIRDDGNFYKITKAESLSEVERRTRELKNKLSCYGAHQRVLICCREELLVDDYFHAVQEAVKGICDRVREMSGLLTDGNELIQTAFSVKNPYIVLNSLRTTSEQNQQNGLKEIILGLIHMVRNVTAHELRIRWDINENDAIDILQQVSFVHKYMDQCITVRHLA